MRASERAPGDRGLSRRRLLEGLIAAGAVTVVAAGAPVAPLLRPAFAAGRYAFPQGLASADPAPDGVVLWTRVEGPGDGPGVGDVPLTLQVAETPDFARVVVERTVTAPAAFDRTVRAVVTGLKPDTVYHYRFLAPDGTTPEFTGRTRTAPAPDADRTVRLAFVSCQSYEDGYYGAYRRLMALDRETPVDFVLHLGDQIYETAGYGKVRSTLPLPSGGRKIRPNAETSPVQADSLEDFRHIYRAYLSDRDYREARALFPFVSIWDDHEFSNDSWQSVATYTPEGRSAAALKVAANQAWFEYIPARLDADFRPATVGDGAATTAPTRADGLADDPDNLKALATLTVWRGLRFGRHVDLILTDTRSYRTDHAVPDDLARALSGTQTYLLPQAVVKLLDAGRAANGGNPPPTLTLGDKQVPNPRKDSPPGTLLGPEQKRWLKDRLKGSTATWKIWANSVPLLPMRLDLHKVDPKAALTVLTADAWDGYQHERNELAGFIADEGIANVVSLSGDHHQHMAGLVHADHDAAEPVAVAAEFSVTGISSSPVFRGFVNALKPDSPLRPLVTFDGAALGLPAGTAVENLNLTFLGGALAAATAAKTGSLAEAEKVRDAAHNGHLRYSDTNANGFGLITVGADGAVAELVTTAPALRDYGPEGAPIIRRARFRLACWAKGGRPVLPPPEFEGEKPFPFV